MEAGGRHKHDFHCIYKHDPTSRKSAFGPSKTGVRASKTGVGPSKTGVPDTKNHDHGAVDVPKMPQLRSTGSKGMPVLWGREFHDRMGRKSTFSGAPTRTGEGRKAGKEGEPPMISRGTTTTTTTTTTTVLIGSTYYLHYYFSHPCPAERFHWHQWGVGVCG